MNYKLPFWSELKASFSEIKWMLDFFCLMPTLLRWTKDLLFWNKLNWRCYFLGYTTNFCSGMNFICSWLMSTSIKNGVLICLSVYLTHKNKHERTLGHHLVEFQTNKLLLSNEDRNVYNSNTSEIHIKFPTQFPCQMAIISLLSTEDSIRKCSSIKCSWLENMTIF